jgi:membrane-bound serine protease (ClpP class)
MLWLMIALLLLGVILVTIEAVTPGLSVPGILGLCSLIAGIFVASTVLNGTALFLLIAGVLVVIVVLIWVVYRSATRGGRVSKLLMLSTRTGREEGFSSASDQSALLGKKGVAVTTLRPTGTAEIEGEGVDVVAEGAFIEKGSPVVVTKVEGFRVVVRKTGA